MNKARFALTLVSIMAMVGAALAYKANRTLRKWYIETTTTTLTGGLVTLCTVPTMYSLIPDDAGNVTIKASTASINVSCPVQSASRVL